MAIDLLLLFSILEEMRSVTGRWSCALSALC